MNSRHSPGNHGAAISCLLFAISLAGPVMAQEQVGTLANSVFGNKHMISAGGARQTADATIRATVTNQEPVALTLSDLGIDDRDQTFFIEYRYRFKPRWSLVAGAYTFSGSGNRTASRDFNYDGVEFTAGSNINATMDVDAYIVDVLYQVYRTDNFELDIGGGLHALDLGVDISGNVSINEFEGDFRQTGTTLLAPVPNIRVAGTWLLTENFGFRYVGGWLSANVDDYSGSFVYSHLRALYSFNDSFGASVGWQYTDVDIEEQRRFSVVDYGIEMNGPTLTLTYSF